MTVGRVVRLTATVVAVLIAIKIVTELLSFLFSPIVIIGAIAVWWLLRGREQFQD